jgi:hypothetical protein
LSSESSVDCKVSQLNDCKVSQLNDCKVSQLNDCKVSQLLEKNKEEKNKRIKTKSPSDDGRQGVDDSPNQPNGNGRFYGPKEKRTPDHLAAQQLFEALSEKRKVTSSAKPKNWHAEFRKLRAELGDDERLRSVLDWYCSHVGQDKVPEAFSASSFREKFIRIESAMTRSANGNGKHPEPTELSADGRKVMKYLEPPLSEWKSAAPLMPAAVEQSLAGWRQLKTALRKLAEGESKFRRLAQHILDDWQHSPDDVGRVQQWFMFYHQDTVATWKGGKWHGKPPVLRVGEAEFEKRIRSFVHDYDHSRPNLWDELKKEAGL